MTIVSCNYGHTCTEPPYSKVFFFICPDLPVHDKETISKVLLEIFMQKRSLYPVMNAHAAGSALVSVMAFQVGRYLGPSYASS
jgi:hypothetical protein